jgi:hypothetical protein
MVLLGCIQCLLGNDARRHDEIVDSRVALNRLYGVPLRAPHFARFFPAAMVALDDRTAVDVVALLDAVPDPNMRQSGKKRVVLARLRPQRPAP